MPLARCHLCGSPTRLEIGDPGPAECLHGCGYVYQPDPVLSNEPWLRDVKALDRRFGRFGVDLQHTTLDQVATVAPKVAKTLTHWANTVGKPTAARLFLTGPTGRIKTTAALAAVRRAVQMQAASSAQVVVSTEHDLIVPRRQDFYERRDPDQYLDNCRVLVVDEFGRTSGTAEWTTSGKESQARIDLFNTIKARRIAVIFTSNIVPAQIRTLLPSEAAYSRFHRLVDGAAVDMDTGKFLALPALEALDRRNAATP